ncbi:MAG TPA: SoxR reducing system RseC family protein [Gammaproteobacteria bacterium]|nr:SoxR reducing system RseC family protein [Gammaproteobacteria bacterium]
MIEETGQVVDVQGEFAWVESERRSACGGCASSEGCGTGVIARAFGNRAVTLKVLNHIGAGIGDRVVIGISETGLVRGALAVYALPLLTLFVGALCGQWLAGGSDVAAIAGAVAGLAAGLAWLARFSRRTRVDAAFQPVVLRQHVGGGL